MAHQSKFSVIGTRPVRHDGLDKVTGRAIYGADVAVPRQAWAEVVRSPHAHAAIRGIDVSDALAMPGVLAVVTAADFPDLPKPITREVRWQSENIMARRKALYRGHAVAAIAAVDRNTAIEAAKLVRVDYKQLPAVLSVEQATTTGASLLHPDAEFIDLERPVHKTNIASHLRLQIGDPDKGFAAADFTIERTAQLQMVHQGYVEPHNATVLWDHDDHVTVWSSTQGMFGIRDQLKNLLQIPYSKISVHSVEIGGGFGGKTTVYLPPLAALLSKKIHRPVKMVMDRTAVFQGTGPAPGGSVRIRIGVTDAGRIMAAEAEVRMEAGAFPGSAMELPTSGSVRTQFSALIISLSAT